MSTIQKAFERGCAAPKRTGISPKGQAAIEYEETERELLRVLARIHNERRARGPVDILPASPTEDDLVRDYLRKKLADLENSPHITPAAIRVMPSPRPHPVVDISLLKLKEGEDYQVDGCLDAPR